ncbi:MAG: AraC family transcriptional regulator [Planctomycetota bacterium]
MDAPTQARSVPQNRDPLGETLHLLKLEGHIYGQAELTAPWGVDLPPIEDTLMFHIVRSGRCLLEVGDESVVLERGSMALVPHGRGHVIRSAEGVSTTPLFDIPVENISERYELMHLGGGGDYTGMLCGVARFDHVAAERLITQLPPLLVVRTWDIDEGSWLNSLLACMAQESKQLKPGGETIITRLADILVIYMIRTWLDQQTVEQERGWLAGLRDPQVGAAMAAIQRDPSKPWTLASLADEVFMSRSAFAARFTEIVGEPAMRYLTQWRMQIARRRLREEGMTLAVLSEELGYASEASFCRAFKREFGTSPGAARKQATERKPA